MSEAVVHRFAGMQWPDLRRTGVAAARGLALFIGGFSLLNVLGELRYPGFDANLWWIDLRPLDKGLSASFLAVASVLLIAYGIRPPRRALRLVVTGGAVAILLAVAVANAVVFHLLASRSVIGAGCPVAFSLFVAAGLTIVLAGTWTDPPSAPSKRWTEGLVIALALAACAAAFPLGQMFCFGMTDYRRPADVVVVFGARVYADGSLSQALGDRVRTACSLYQDGLVRKIVVSGGPGDGEIHETEGMRRMALHLGVPEANILVDERGLNTQATVRNTCGIFAARGMGRVLVVSHFYHLPRIKLAYQRQDREVYTVPARQTRPLTALPLYMAREVAALWLYYLRPLWLDTRTTADTMEASQQ
jgi:uncharacterized SAM-binding protein YcdF (DUF218 family)